MGGFNPLRHAHYYPMQSVLNRWLNAPWQSNYTAEEEIELAKEALLLAHDYLHDWAYRVLFALDPTLQSGNPKTHDDLITQAFFLVLTEAAAVTGMDYWYLCVKDMQQRCGTSFDVGPCTVHYREGSLPAYRRSNPNLIVQSPEFFIEVVRLYSEGVIVGFNEQDLLANRPLAEWLIRELLIAPRQREVSRLWLSHMSRIEVDLSQLHIPFKGLLEKHRTTVTELGKLLWRKVKYGAHLFLPPRRDVIQWRYDDDAPIDFRFANVNRVSGRNLVWRSVSAGTESWCFFVDQTVAGRHLPKDRATREHIAERVAAIKSEFDIDELAKLMAELPAIENPDPAPLELLFVN